MSDPLRDARFPGRPQSADYWRISEVILWLDGQADAGVQVEAVVADAVDLEAALYAGKQRALRAVGEPLRGTRPVELLAGMWLDGFMAGMLFQQRGGHRD